MSATDVPSAILFVLAATYTKTSNGSNTFDIQAEGCRQELLDMLIVVLMAIEFL